jgi:hypothetical protein
MGNREAKKMNLQSGLAYPNPQTQTLTSCVLCAQVGRCDAEIISDPRENFKGKRAR